MERFKVVPAAYVFLVRDGHVLMLRRHRTGYEDGNYSVPAGHFEGNEPATVAAVREAEEECGASILPEDLLPVCVMHRRAADERVDFFFAATRWSGEVRNCEPEKCDDLAWYPLDGLPPNTIPYIRVALDNYRQGIWFSEFGWNKD